MNRFVARDTIKHLGSRLKSDLHANVRSHLQKLLVKEEDKLGTDLEFLAEVERMIGNFEALIETQNRIIETLEKNGLQSGPERATLDGLRTTHVSCQMYRQKILFACGKTVL